MPRLLIVLAPLLCGPVPSNAQDLPPTTEQVMGVPAPPTHTITLRDECNVVDVFWSADSSRAYASMEVTAVDVWPLLVRFWPEIAAGATGLILLIVLARMLWKHWRRRRVAAIGEPHCARCSYQLTGRTEAKVCPECGAPLGPGRIVLGRALRRWPVALTAALLVLIAGGYYVGRTRLPRAGTVSQWRHWPSTRLCNWATNHQYWSLTSPRATFVRIVEIDPATGSVVRTVFNAPTRRRDGLRWSARLYSGVTPDRFFMLASMIAAEIDIASGTVVHEYRLPPDYADPKIGLCDIALHPSRPLLYAYVDYQMVGAWDLDTGEWSELTAFPGRSEYVMYSLFAIDAADTVILRRVLDRRAAESGFDLVDLKTLETLVTHREPKRDLSQIVGIAEDALLITFRDYTATRSGSVMDQTILRWSPGMAEPETIMTIPVRHLCTIRSGRSGRIYFSGFPIASGRALPIVAVFDHARGSYLEPLQSNMNADMALSVAPDEHWAITSHPEPTRDPGLFIFDLRAIHGPRSEQ